MSSANASGACLTAINELYHGPIKCWCKLGGSTYKSMNNQVALNLSSIAVYCNYNLSLWNHRSGYIYGTSDPWVESVLFIHILRGPHFAYPFASLPGVSLKISIYIVYINMIITWFNRNITYQMYQSFSAWRTVTTGKTVLSIPQQFCIPLLLDTPYDPQERITHSRWQPMKPR